MTIPAISGHAQSGHETMGLKVRGFATTVTMLARCRGAACLARLPASQIRCRGEACLARFGAKALVASGKGAPHSITTRH